MNFLKLHDANDNTLVLISVENILCVFKGADQKTYIEVKDSEYEFSVNESVEKILAMLENEKS